LIELTFQVAILITGWSSRKRPAAGEPIECHDRTAGQTENDEPQPHVDDALGFFIAK
jgi:hypothetical protein